MRVSWLLRFWSLRRSAEKPLRPEKNHRSVKTKKTVIGFFLLVALFALTAPQAAANFTYHLPNLVVNSPVQATNYHNSSIYVDVRIDFHNIFSTDETIHCINCTIMGEKAFNTTIYPVYTSAFTMRGNCTINDLPTGPHTLEITCTTTYGHVLSATLWFRVNASVPKTAAPQPTATATPTPTPTPTPTITSSPTATPQTTPTLTTTDTPTPENANNQNPNVYWIVAVVTVATVCAVIGGAAWAKRR